MYSRELLKGILKPIILKLLDEHSKMYGYEIVQHVKSSSNGKVLIKEGSLYPSLHALTKEGYLETEAIMVGNRTRKYYRLTSKGKEAVAPAVNEVLDFQNTLSTLFSKPKTALS